MAGTNDRMILNIRHNPAATLEEPRSNIPANLDHASSVSPTHDIGTASITNGERKWKTEALRGPSCRLHRAAGKKKIRTYDLLDKLGIPFWRDHGWMKADTME